MVMALDLTTSSPAIALNQVELARMSRRETGLMLLLFGPVALLLTALVLIPVGWLFYLSIVEGDHYSLVHYGRMLTYSSYSSILWVTFKISVIVTVICALLGYPVAYLLAQLPRAAAVACLALVVIPFWTSILVRTYSWLVLLGASGPIAPYLHRLQVISDPLGLLYNQIGTTIGMVHIMMPFFILPLYSTLRSFDWTLVQAASSLGASPVSAFWRVFLPLSLPGVWAGALLVFIQALGFYVTPSLLGGGKVNFVSMKIANNIQEYFDWGAASAYGVVLLVCALGMLILTSRLIGADRVLRIEK